MAKEVMFLKRINMGIWALMLIFSITSWINPGAEAAGLSPLYQLGWVVVPLVLVILSIMEQKNKRRKAILTVAGYAGMMVCIYLALSGAGISLNIGEIPLNEIMNWATPWLWACIISCGLSLMLSVTILFGAKDE